MSDKAKVAYVPGTRVPDLTKKCFGFLTVIEYVGIKPDRDKRSYYWRCRCDCGNEVEKTTVQLKAVNMPSCNCRRWERASAAMRKHGKCGTTEYRTWNGMIQRCTNRKNRNYRHYGGRGINICRRWQGKNGFVNFLADMGEKPSKGLSLERKNNNRGYCPSNCKWATKKEQSRNLRKTVRVPYGGIKLTLPEWSERLGIPLSRLKGRYYAGKRGKQLFDPGTQHCNQFSKPD